MDPKPKMQILNKKEYLEKFDLGIPILYVALAHSLSNQHQEALNLLLELKSKRWVNFQLFHQIAQEYLALGQFDEAQQQMKQLSPQNEEQKQNLLQLEGLIQGIIKYDFNQLAQLIEENHKEQLELREDYKILEKTQEMPDQEKIDYIIAVSSYIQSDNFGQVIRVVQILYHSGLFHQMTIFIQSQYGQDFKKIFDLPKDNQFVIIKMLCANQQYQTILSLLNHFQQDYEILFYKGFCHLQLKQYKEALKCYQQSIKLNKNIHSHLKLMFLNKILRKTSNGICEYSEYSLSLQITYFNFAKYCKKVLDKNQSVLQIHELQLQISGKQNRLMFLYPELFWLRYELNRQDPMLQAICDFLLKYAKLYAAGYSCQYALYMDQDKKDQLNTLVQPLLLCDESTLKYVTLAKIYKEQQKYDKAHQALINATNYNKYDEDIYLVKIDLYHKQQNYRMAFETMRELVKLEKENFAFVNEIVFDLLSKYEYYRAVELLNLADQESEALQELQIFMRIISCTNLNRLEQNNNLLDSIQSLELQTKLLFQGHYQLRLNKIQDGLQFYNSIQVKENEQKDLINNGISLITNQQHQQLNEYQQIDIICQMSSFNTKYQADPTKIFNRYRDTLAFVLSSIIFNQSIEQVCEYINTHYDMEVPVLLNLKEILLQNIQLIYRKDYIKLETYIGYLESGLQQLNNLSQKPECLLITFYDYCSDKEQDITESITKSDHQTYGLDDNLLILYQNPFFFDPISRYALFRVVKMIGYFCENELTNNYNKMEDWIQFYLLAPNIDGYFKVFSKQKFSKQN